MKRLCRPGKKLPGGWKCSEQSCLHTAYKKSHFKTRFQKPAFKTLCDSNVKWCQTKLFKGTVSESQSLNNNIFSTENHLNQYQWVYPLTLNPINPKVIDSTLDQQTWSAIWIIYQLIPSRSVLIRSWGHVLSTICVPFSKYLVLLNL